LVSTTPDAHSISQALGSPRYSYYFVFEALRPTLELLGTCTFIDRPESRLSHAASEARKVGKEPIHLSINPLQDAFLAPDVPNIVFPFWEFPDLPNRSFGHDTRQDWTRCARRADLILTACKFTAEAFAQSGIETPIAVVPVPLPEWTTSVTAWSFDRTAVINCRYIELDELKLATTDSLPQNTLTSTGRRKLLRGPMRAIFQRIAPRLGQRWMERIAKARQACAGQSPSRVPLLLARHAYRRMIRDWLSDKTIDRIHQKQRTLLRRLGIARESLDPEIDLRDLRLSGLVYTSFLALGDPRKNPGDLLSAFVLAFQDQPEVTLVLKLATNRRRAFNEISVLRKQYTTLGLTHACRIVVIADFLSDQQIADLMACTTFYVNTSHAEGACLPLQQALGAGRPAIAPAHTAMSDYIDDSVGFVIGSDVEPCAWPHDPEQRMETERHRLRWSDLHANFLASKRCAVQEPEIYQRLAEAGRTRMRANASVLFATECLRKAIFRLTEHPVSLQN
jgi:glycosyltransferase involved in cell wall biosynthesis